MIIAVLKPADYSSRPIPTEFYLLSLLRQVLSGSADPQAISPYIIPKFNIANVESIVRPFSIENGKKQKLGFYFACLG